MLKLYHYIAVIIVCCPLESYYGKKNSRDFHLSSCIFFSLQFFSFLQNSSFLKTTFYGVQNISLWNEPQLIYSNPICLNNFPTHSQSYTFVRGGNRQQPACNILPPVSHCLLVQCLLTTNFYTLNHVTDQRKDFKVFYNPECCFICLLGTTVYVYSVFI